VPARDDAHPTSRLRLDKWLWHARFARTRTRAQELVASGHVRIDGVRTRDPARAVKIGDVLTVAMEGRTMVVRVVGLPDGRGSYEIARLAYEELAELKR